VSKNTASVGAVAEQGGGFQNVNLYKNLRAGQCQNSMVLHQNEENQTFIRPFGIFKSVKIFFIRRP